MFKYGRMQYGRMQYGRMQYGRMQYGRMQYGRMQRKIPSRLVCASCGACLMFKLVSAGLGYFYAFMPFK